MTPTWVILSLAGIAFSLFVAFLIRGYLFMDKVETNHLAHIQADMAKVAASTALLAESMRLHDEHEAAHHTTLVQELRFGKERAEERARQEREAHEALLELIRIQGL